MRLEDTPVRRPVSVARVLAVDATGARSRPDRLATEEPLEIRLHGPDQEPTALAVTMRTPGHDFELAVGFCVSEGLLRDPEELARVAYCLDGRGVQQYNVVTVRHRRAVTVERAVRNFVTSSSCGICGKATLDDVEQRCAPVGPGPVVAASVVRSLPERLLAAQRVFDETGGLHAAASFAADGTRRELREDVGRHNALDKLVGNAFLARSWPMHDAIVMLSGRLSFELVQKAAVAGIPVLCAVSAPSSLAVAAAARFGQTIVGFVRDDRFNVYTHPERIAVDA